MNEPLSVVIAAYNAEATIGNQLAALAKQPWPRGGEIIVADNGSSDATPAIVREHMLTLKSEDSITISLVGCGGTPGAGHARNVGVANSQFGHIAFCDADDVVDHGWVQAIGEALDHHQAVGGRLALDLLNPEWVIESRGPSLAADALPIFDDTFPVLSSCNLGIHRILFDEVGGFDETYLRGQDAELSFRLYERGADPQFVSDAVVHYRLRSNLRAVFTQAKGWGEANARIRKQLPARRRLRSSVRSWLWLVANTHHLASPTTRARWIYIAGLRIGLAKAAIGRTT